MGNITAAGSFLSSLSPSNFVKKKMGSLVTGVVANSISALNKQSGTPKEGIDRVNKIGEDQVSRFERIFAAHTRANAVDNMVSHLMSKKDTNGDGVLNAAEFGIPKEAFGNIDKNGDGQVAKAELSTAFHARIQAISERTNHLIARKDTNGDGMLNIGELGVPEELFSKIDKNGDGQAGSVELSIAARTHAALNNMISEIVPPEKASKLDATV
ncbi:MAG: hypothetical protein MAG551_01275 [Candidatus Scalindua arabica]|uniref:EF-hand domain-containing protein n=1 Tax=Candidatus Scalindua arabica TaxID=1127984 RepID=A0A941W280_9BACT|nr:hypothetical protein [Candidatus Scalindua arabica]